MLRVCVCLFVFPSMLWGFSDTELDSLAKSGSKSSSQSPWRSEISWQAQRNALLNSSYTNNRGQDLTNPLSLKAKDSLLDISTFYYSFSFTLYYSLEKSLQDKTSAFLNRIKKTELFLSSSFSSPVLGHKNELKDYGFLDYAHYALGNLNLGAVTRVYSSEKFFSDFSFFLSPLPLNRFSQEVGFLFSYGGKVNFLYFLKKSGSESWSLSSGHLLAFSEYSKETADLGAEIVNTPLSAVQSLALTYRQSARSYIPSSLSLSAEHYLGLNFEKQVNQDLSFSLRSSWKIKEQLYVSGALSWKDRVYIFNPDQPEIGLVNPVEWFGKRKTVFSLGASYRF